MAEARFSMMTDQIVAMDDVVAVAVSQYALDIG
jgi:hypothetical protein